MSNSVWPHRRQPTRLPCPWDSPGKNTGVGCHFLLQCMKVKSESEVAQSCPTLSDPRDCSLSGSSVHGIFQARVLEWGAIAFSECRVKGLENPILNWIDSKNSTGGRIHFPCRKIQLNFPYTLHCYPVLFARFFFLTWKMFLKSQTHLPLNFHRKELPQKRTKI